MIKETIPHPNYLSSHLTSNKKKKQEVKNFNSKHFFINNPSSFEETVHKKMKAKSEWDGDTIELNNIAMSIEHGELMEYFVGMHISRM